MLRKTLLAICLLPLCVAAEPISREFHGLGRMISHAQNGWLLSLDDDRGSLSGLCRLRVTRPGFASEVVDELSVSSCGHLDYYRTGRIGWVNQLGDVGYIRSKYPGGDASEVEGGDYVLRRANGQVQTLTALPEQSKVRQIGTSRTGYHYVLLALDEFRFKLMTYVDHQLLYDLTFDYQIAGPGASSDEFQVVASDVLPDGRVLLNLRLSDNAGDRRTAVVTTSGALTLLQEDPVFDDFDYSYGRRSFGYTYISETGEVYFTKDEKTYRTKLDSSATEFRPYQIVAFYDENAFVRRVNEHEVFESDLTGDVHFERCYFRREDWDHDYTPQFADLRLFRQGDHFFMSEYDDRSLITIPNGQPENFCVQLSVKPHADCRSNFRKARNGDLAIRREFGSPTKCSFTGRLLKITGEGLEDRSVAVNEHVPPYGKSTGVSPRRVRTDRSGSFRFRGSFAPNSTGIEVKGPVRDASYRLRVTSVGVR